MDRGGIQCTGPLLPDLMLKSDPDTALGLLEFWTLPDFILMLYFHLELLHLTFPALDSPI